MADRVVAMVQDEEGVHYLWDSGYRVTFNPQTKEWSKQRIPHPNDLPNHAAEPNRELAAEVYADD